MSRLSCHVPRKSVKLKKINDVLGTPSFALKVVCCQAGMREWHTNGNYVAKMQSMAIKSILPLVTRGCAQKDF